LLPAFHAVQGSDTLLPLRCSSLSAAARRQWIAAIEERPHDFVVQRDVTPSVAPSIERRGARLRPVVWRTFALNAADGPVVLPGGIHEGCLGAGDRAGRGGTGSAGHSPSACTRPGCRRGAEPGGGAAFLGGALCRARGADDASPARHAAAFVRRERAPPER